MHMNYSPSPRDELRMLTNDLRAYVEAIRVWGVQHIPADQAHARRSPDPSVAQAPHPPAPSPAHIGADRPPVASASFADVQELPLPLEPSLDPISRLSLPELEA